jgi:spore coat protein U-like protein
MKTQKFNGRALSLAVASILAVGVGAFSGSSYAATTANLTVTATITKSCAITGGTLAFGSFDVLAGVKNGTGVINATCTNDTPYVIGMSVGAGVGATETVRKMTGAGGTLNYTLSPDVNQSVNWGAGATVELGGVAGLGNGVAQEITVFGQIPAGQTSAKAGTDYTDTVVATINF